MRLRMVALVLVTRLPLLAAGFGADFDAWLLAESARGLIEEGVYEPSRPPGYPVVEAGLALLVPLGAVACNAASALLSVASVLLLRDLARRGGASAPSALALALALTPGVWIASASTMDYLWALTFGLACLAAAVRGRARAGGVWLGLAIGARATSLVFAVPAVILLAGGGRRTLLAIGTGLGAATYLPVLLAEGPAWFLSPPLAHPGAAVAARHVHFGLLGELGTAALAVALGLALAGRARPASAPVARAGAWLAVLELGLYAAAPYEPEYLIPAVAGLLLWMGPRLHRTVAYVLPVALGTASLVGLTQRAPVPRDLARRREELALIEIVREAVHATRRPTALLCGRMFPKVRYALGGGEEVGPVVLHVAIRTETRLRELLERGVELRYVPGIEEWYVRQNGYRVERVAQPITSP